MSRRALRRRPFDVRFQPYWVGRACGAVHQRRLSQSVGRVGRSFHCCARRCWPGGEAELHVGRRASRLGRGVVFGRKGREWQGDQEVRRTEVLRLELIAHLE